MINFNFNINPKLSTKGKILVAIPLTVQLLSVVVLSTMLGNAEQQTAKIERSREIVNEALTIAKQVYDTEYALYELLENARLGKDSNYKVAAARYEALKENIPPHLEQLQRLVQSRPKEKEVAEKFIRLTRGLLKLLERMRTKLDEGDINSVFTLGVIMTYSKGVLTQMSTQLEKLTDLEKEDGGLQDQARRGRQQVQALLYVSVAVNVLVVIALLIAFNRNTISRLSVLMGNTKRMASDQDLSAQLHGHDEIAELDRVFHEMADAMKAARQREAELIEIKKQIMAVVSHDLRAPLTSLQGTLALLNRNMYGELTEQGRQRVESSDHSVRRLIRMINDLLDLEKLEAGKMVLEIKDLPLVVLIARAVEDVTQLAADKGVRFEYDENSELEVQGDGDRLIQVLVNILSNAVKYSPQDGVIKIESQLVDQTVKVCVTDQGPGVPEDMREAIFERYRQIEDSAHKGKGGTGLGLAICKLIMEMHSGAIGVEPSAPNGSTFWFTLLAVVPSTDFDTAC